MIGSAPRPRMVRIARGGSSDLDQVTEVMASAFEPGFGEAWTRSQCAGILPMTGVELVLAHEGAAAVGFALFRTIAGEAELLLLAVSPGHQRKGIGQRLLDDFLATARANGAARVHLEVRDGNGAISMYRKAGFAPVGRRRNYYNGLDGKQFDALTLAREI